MLAGSGHCFWKLLFEKCHYTAALLSVNQLIPDRAAKKYTDMLYKRGLQVSIM